MLSEYDKVNTLVDKGKYKAGTVGVVVSFYSGGPECEVELWDDNEQPIDVVTYNLDEVEKIK